MKKDLRRNDHHGDPGGGSVVGLICENDVVGSTK